MIKVKDLKFEDFNFSRDRRILETLKHYDNNKTYCVMQLTLINYKKLDLKAFSVDITIHESLPNNRWGKYIGRQFANMTLDGVQDARINPNLGAFNKDLLPNEKQGIDKKYIPWVQSAIALFIEANHDLVPEGQ